MRFTGWWRRGGWHVRNVVLVCTVFTTLTYPLSERLARNGGVEVTVTVEQCEDEIKVTESYAALGEHIGQDHVVTYPVAPSNSVSPERDPSRDFR